MGAVKDIFISLAVVMFMIVIIAVCMTIGALAVFVVLEALA